MLLMMIWELYSISLMDGTAVVPSLLSRLSARNAEPSRFDAILSSITKTPSRSRNSMIMKKEIERPTITSLMVFSTTYDGFGRLSSFPKRSHC